MIILFNAWRHNNANHFTINLIPCSSQQCNIQDGRISLFDWKKELPPICGNNKLTKEVHIRFSESNIIFVILTSRIEDEYQVHDRSIASTGNFNNLNLKENFGFAGTYEFFNPDSITDDALGGRKKPYPSLGKINIIDFSFQIILLYYNSNTYFLEVYIWNLMWLDCQISHCRFQIY